MNIVFRIRIKRLVLFGKIDFILNKNHYFKYATTYLYDILDLFPNKLKILWTSKN